MKNEQVVARNINQFYAKIYAFLALGIGVSAVVSYLVLNVFSYQVGMFFNNYPFAFYAIWIAEIVVVLFLGVKAMKNPTLAMGGFLVYAILNGITLSLTISMYTDGTVVTAFISAAATFAGMALIGVFTKKDLSALGHAALSALIGILIAMVLNMFILKSSPVDYLISFLMIIVFAGLTAYDNQNIRKLYHQANGQPETGMAVFMALQLYLDFINLFISFLRIFGKNN